MIRISFHERAHSQCLSSFDLLLIAGEIGIISWRHKQRWRECFDWSFDQLLAHSSEVSDPLGRL